VAIKYAEIRNATELSYNRMEKTENLRLDPFRFAGCAALRSVGCRELLKLISERC